MNASTVVKLCPPHEFINKAYDLDLDMEEGWSALLSNSCLCISYFSTMRVIYEIAESIHTLIKDIPPKGTVNT